MTRNASKRKSKKPTCWVPLVDADKEWAPTKTPCIAPALNFEVGDPRIVMVVFPAASDLEGDAYRLTVDEAETLKQDLGRLISLARKQGA